MLKQAQCKTPLGSQVIKPGMRFYDAYAIIANVTWCDDSFYPIYVHIMLSSLVGVGLSYIAVRLMLL